MTNIVKSYEDVERLNNIVKTLILSVVNSDIISEEDIKELFRKLEKRVYELNTDEKFNKAYFNEVSELLLSIYFGMKIKEAGSFERFLKTDKLSSGEVFLDKLISLLLRTWLDLNFTSIRKLEEFILDVLKYTAGLYKKFDGFVPEEDLKEYILRRLLLSEYFKNRLPKIIYILKKSYRYYPPEKIETLKNEIREKTHERLKVIDMILRILEKIYSKLEKLQAKEYNQEQIKELKKKLKELKDVVENYLEKIREINVNDPTNYVNSIIILTELARDVLKYRNEFKKIINDKNIPKDIKQEVLKLVYITSKFLEDVLSKYIEDKLNETIEPDEKSIRKVLEEKIAEKFPEEFRKKLEEFNIKSPQSFVLALNKVYWFLVNHYTTCAYNLGYKKALKILGIPEEEWVKPILSKKKKVSLQPL